MAIWKELIKIGAFAGGTAFGGGPQTGALAASAVSGLLKGKDKDNFEEWEKIAKKLRDDESLTNEQRREMLDGKIGGDLWEQSGPVGSRKIPEQRQIEWLRQTVVLSIKGDFSEEEEQGG